MARTANQVARCLIGRSEGLRLQAYKDSGGTWTIGWGATRVNGKPVTEGMVVTREQAAACFNHDIALVEAQVSSLVKVPLTDNMFGALVSFTFNLGAQALKTSTLLKKLNAKDYAGAAAEFERWVYAKKRVLAGLETRRRKEKQLFCTPDK
jgi:GH24 family phage-related lysozyme (muramidase)